MLGIRPTDPVSSITGTPVATIRPTETLRAAASALVADTIGLLVVVDYRGVLGVLSERDLTAAIADDSDLDDERVLERASMDVVKVEETVSILQAAQTMVAAEVRHLAVCRNDEVIGVVSIRDVLVVLVENALLETAVH